MEYWVMEWAYSSDHVARYEGPNKDIPVTITADKWNSFYLTEHTLEYCLERLMERMRGEEKHQGWLMYHWRIRDLHSGEIIPGELL